MNFYYLCIYNKKVKQTVLSICQITVCVRSLEYFIYYYYWCDLFWQFKGESKNFIINKFKT